MNLNFIFDYPWWFILICLLAGANASALLYYKNRSDDFSLLQKRLMAAFRFVVISLLSFFLLSPLLKLQVTQRQEPIILFFQDNSQSLIVGPDSAFIAEIYSEEIQRFFSGLEEDYILYSHTFGDDVRVLRDFNYQDKLTDISEIFSSIETQYTNRNIGAVVIASDGIYNRGRNPVYQSSSSFTPLYTIALGDTTPRKDLIINRLRHNRITYLNNIFPLEITVEARQVMGETSMLRVIHAGESVFEQRVSFTSDAHFETVTAELEATETGIKRYSVEIESIEDEITLENNTQDFFIEVIGRQGYV